MGSVLKKYPALGIIGEENRTGLGGEMAFCVTFEADITKFRHMVKEEGLSFTLAMVSFTYLNRETNAAF